MSCEAYNQSLMDAATSGELAPALRTHLTQCDSCHAAFAQDQMLYAAIDTGLHAAANPEIPSTFLPRVHVALNNEAVQTTARFFPTRLLISGGIVAAFLCVFVASRFLRHEPRQDALVNSPVVASASVWQTASGPRNREVSPRIHLLSRRSGSAATRRSGPQVLLPVGHVQTSDRLIAALRTVRFSGTSEIDKKELPLESLTLKPIEIEPLKPVSNLGD